MLCAQELKVLTQLEEPLGTPNPQQLPATPPLAGRWLPPCPTACREEASEGRMGQQDGGTARGAVRGAEHNGHRDSPAGPQLMSVKVN